MTHVLIIYEVEEPCNIEKRRVLKMLEAKGKLQSKGIFESQVTKKDLEWSDVLLMVRSTSSIERDLSALDKKMGKFVILMLDADFFGHGSSYGADGPDYRKVRHNVLRKY